MAHDFSHLHVEFFLDKKHNKRLSAEKKTKIFDEIEKVKIRIAGDTKSVHVAPAHDQSSAYGPDGERLTYAELHAGPYEAFKAGLSAPLEGTPIGLLPTLSPAKEATLKAANIHTIEQLADLDGAFLSKLGMGARALKQEAEECLANSGNGDISELSKENEDLKERLAVLEAMMKKTTAPADKVEAAPHKAKKAEKEDDIENPFADGSWDLETIKAWMDEQGGKFDARWSLERAQKAAFDLNEEIAKKAE